MKNIISVFLILLCFTIHVKASESEHFYKGEISTSFQKRTAYLIEFNFDKKVPKWVAYHILPSYLPAPPRKKFGTFKDDPNIENESTEGEYKNQFNTWRNYAKGHLAPYYFSGGDRDHDGKLAVDGDEDDIKTVEEIMYMSNMAPQHHYNFNGSGGLWYSLETFVREELIKKLSKEVWVYAGTIFGPTPYDKIGTTEVPAMFWKIVVTEVDSKPLVLAFLFPHQIKKHGDIQDYLVSINVIEAMTGLDFFMNLNNEELERESTWENWKKIQDLLK